MKELPSKSRKKNDHYYYVTAGSEEADTLKDKFWRDLDQGKITFDKSEDLYTRVKRGAKQAQVSLRLNICAAQGDIISSSDKSLSIDSSTSCCATDSGYSLGGTSVPDVSTPASSGYESSSIPSVDPVTAADSPVDSAMPQSVCETEHNNYYSKKKRAVLFVKKKRQLLKKTRFGKSAISNRAAFHKAKSLHRKYFDLVDPLSAEADTLKDKFWRDLDMGKVNIMMSADLYSSVKVSRQKRPRAVSSESGGSLSLAKSAALTDVGMSSSGSLSTAPALSNFELVTGNEIISSTSSIFSQDMLKSGPSDSSGHETTGKVHVEATCVLPSRHSGRNVDEAADWCVTKDSKLLSPCEVTVERLLLDGSLSSCALHLPPKCLSNSDKKQDKSEPQEECRVVPPLKLIRRPHSRRYSAANDRRKSRYVAADGGLNEVSRDSRVAEKKLIALQCVDPAEETSGMKWPTPLDIKAMICSEPDKPCHSVFTVQRWLNGDFKAEPVCVRAKGTLFDLIELGDCNSVQLYLQHRSLPIDEMLKAVNRQGLTPLMLSASLGHCRIMKLLACNGANVNAQTASGMTALMIACDQGLVSVVDVLLALHVQMEIRDGIGETALMKAVRGGHCDVVERLLSNGANTAQVSDQRETASSIARRHANLEHVSVIIDGHIIRRSHALQDALRESLQDYVSIGAALFPLNCFSTTETVDSFNVTFRCGLDTVPSGCRPFLFIGHSLMGQHIILCRLSGVSSVCKVLLNGVQLCPMGEDEHFMMLCEPLQESNNLVIHLKHNSLNSMVRLLVCAFFIQPACNLLLSSNVDVGETSLPPDVPTSSQSDFPLSYSAVDINSELQEELPQVISVERQFVSTQNTSGESRLPAMHLSEEDVTSLTALPSSSMHSDSGVQASDSYMVSDCRAASVISGTDFPYSSSDVSATSPFSSRLSLSEGIIHSQSPVLDSSACRQNSNPS